MRDLDDMGPVDYLVVEFPDGRVTGEGLPLLVDLVERGIIRILDLVFVRKRGDGTVEGLELTDVDHDGKLDLLMFEGVTTGLVDAEDLADAADVLNQGSVAAILVYENRWAAPLATTLRRGGGQLVAGGRIPVQALLAAVERVDTEVSR
ncbi:DUF6325 family protein [Dactylosporangium sp. NPDC049742]|uniref:DUF6325 family protein n=1 Tax=Dactylosporangium sp. NPDC049742 TaxID=3154737 RepID=UPI00344ADFED